MNKILFLLLFLSASFFSPSYSQTKKSTKKPTSAKTEVKKTSNNKTASNAANKKSKPAAVSKTTQKTQTPADKKTTKTTVSKNNISQKKNTGKNIPDTKKITKTKNIKSNCIKYSVSKKVKNVLTTAKTYEGVPYKLGGNTRKGIDCSALVKASFKKANVELPRRSIEMSSKGTAVKTTKIKEGDLLFFATSKGKINHVAIVYKIKEDGIISFIHASSSRGVMISDLNGSYWPERFVSAKRII